MRSAGPPWSAAPASSPTDTGAPVLPLALDLSECRIGDKGVRHLTQAKWWPNLVEVNLRNNPVSRIGVKHLLDAPVPLDLAALVLDGDAFGGDGRAALAKKFGDDTMSAASP